MIRHLYLGPLDAEIQGRVCAFLDSLTEAETEHFRPPRENITAADCLACAEHLSGSGEILGLAGWSNNVREARVFVCIRKSWWGRRWGRILTEMVLDRVPPGLLVRLAVDPGHQPAISLYESLGFYGIGLRETEHVLMMERPPG